MRAAFYSFLIFTLTLPFWKLSFFSFSSYSYWILNIVESTAHWKCSTSIWEWEIKLIRNETNFYFPFLNITFHYLAAIHTKKDDRLFFLHKWCLENPSRVFIYFSDVEMSILSGCNSKVCKLCACTPHLHVGHPLLSVAVISTWVVGEQRTVFKPLLCLTYRTERYWKSSSLHCFCLPQSML